jgi:CheY-like chemotaxis protein
VHTCLGQTDPQPAAQLAILLVEDDVLVRLATAEALRAAGLVVLEAANADEALMVLRRSTPIDAVVTDIRMPGAMDGLGLAATVRAKWPDLKIIMVSGESGGSSAVADAFFGKPVDPARLIHLLRQLVPRTTS